jgi:hypothetical protein
MHTLSLKIGFWAALLSALTYVLYAVCFVAILVVNPLFVWSDLAAYAATAAETNQFFKHLAEFGMLLYAPLFVLLLNSIHELAPAPKKVLARASILFGLGFAILSSTAYFLQLSTVRLAVDRGTWSGLELLVMANPSAAITAVNVLGWTLFLGFASLLAAPLFGGSRLERAISLSFLANGIICLLGALGFVLDITWLVFLTLYLGVGGAGLAIAITLTIHFRRLTRESPLVEAELLQAPIPNP